MKFTTKSLMLMALSVLYIGEAMAPPKKVHCKWGAKCWDKTAKHREKYIHPEEEQRYDGVAGPFTRDEFIKYYGPDEGMAKWDEAGEKRLDGGEGPFSMREFMEYHGEEKGKMRWDAAAGYGAPAAVVGRPGSCAMTTTCYTGGEIEANSPRAALALAKGLVGKYGPLKGEAVTGFDKGKIRIVKQFSFSKVKADGKAFTLSDALEFADPDFQEYFMATYRAFAKKHAPNHIWFDFKKIENKAALDRTDNIEWVLIAHNYVHDFAPSGRSAPGGTKYYEDVLQHDWDHAPLPGQKCSTRLCFPKWLDVVAKKPVLKTSGSKRGTVQVGTMICPCDMGETVSGAIESGLKGDEQGGRCLNMANFFRQSSDAEVIGLMQATFRLARTGVDEGRQNMHVYAYGGSRPWLHMRCEWEKTETTMANDGHFIWY